MGFLTGYESKVCAQDRDRERWGGGGLERGREGHRSVIEKD